MPLAGFPQRGSHLVTNTLQKSVCVQQLKDTHTGVDRQEREKKTEFTFLGERSL